jgi:penicillin-binding protein 1B
VQLDKATNRLATPTCPDDYVAAFVAGTEPRETCDQQNGVAGLFSRFFGGGQKALAPVQGADAQDSQDPNAQDPKKKKGFFGKLAGIFKDDKSSTPPPKPPDTAQPVPH